MKITYLVLIGATGWLFSANAYAKHNHEISQVNGLQEVLDTKADQTQVDQALATKADQSDVDALSAALDTKAEQAEVNELRDRVDALADTTIGILYGNRTVVATSGGEYSDPVAAMNDVGSWCGIPSNANPCLLKVMPGVYDLGGSSVILMPYVDMEGSGKNVTRIIGSRGSISTTSNGVIVGADQSEVRDLTVEVTGSASGRAIAFFQRNGAGQYTNVAAIADGNGISDAVGFYLYQAGVVIKDVSVIAINGNGYSFGLYKYGSDRLEVESSEFNSTLGTFGSFGLSFYSFDSTELDKTPIRMSNVQTTSGNAISLTGVYSTPAHLTIINSEFVGAINTNRSFHAFDIVNTRIDRAFDNQLVGMRCLGTYDANLTPIACP